MFLVYKTDNWHSYQSRDIIGLCTSAKKVIKICNAQAKKEGHKINKDQLFNLQTYNQTQGYKGEGEFHIEYVENNILL
jgi:hypothetical protein